MSVIIVFALLAALLGDPVNGCVKYACTEDEKILLTDRIKYNGRLLTCSYFAKPGRDCPCWLTENNGDQCWDMGRAEDGKCFRGECYNKQTYNSLTKDQRLKTAAPCGGAHDYLFNSRGAFGCQYYCKTKPHRIVNRPDGHQCLNPATAYPGGCYGGNCHKNYRGKD
uniref:Putative salivary secreted protein n=1 Tax=Ornithodoros turicata TaxID=34597 RepID=A0A2R5LAY3_9ACAR